MLVKIVFVESHFEDSDNFLGHLGHFDTYFYLLNSAHLDFSFSQAGPHFVHCLFFFIYVPFKG